MMEVEEELAIVFSELIECLSEFISNFTEIGSADTKELANQAGDLLNLLEDASAQIGQNDAQYVGGRDILKSLQDLLLEAAKTDHGGGVKFMIKMFQNKIEHFRRLVNSDWNRNVAKEVASKESSVPESTGRENNRTPTKDKGRSKVVYKKITPRKVQTEYKCTEEGCNKSTKNLTVFKRHMIEAHKKEAEPRKAVTVTCMLPSKKKKRAGEICNSKQPLSGMYRHLEDVHDQPPRPSDKYLRFFKSYDGGKTYTEPVYLGISEKDPDGIIDDNCSSAVKECSEERPVKTSNNDGADGDDTHDKVKRPDESHRKTSGAGATSVLDEDTGDAAMDADTGDAAMDEDTGDAAIEEDTGDAAMDKDTGYAENTTGCLPDPAKNENTDEDLKEVGSKPDSEKSKLDDGSKPEESNLTPNRRMPMLVDDLEDVVCPDSVFDRSDEDGSNEEAQCEELILEEDSDEEEDDDPDFTQKRLANKKMRYEKRNQLDLFKVDLWEEEANLPVVEEFDAFLRTIKYASNANKKNPTIGKSVGHMAKYPDSYLNFHRKNDPNFSLNKLTDFKSNNYVLLSEPITWMNSIAGSGQDQPLRRREQLKAWERFQDFLLFKLQKTDFENTIMDILKKKEMKSQIEDLGDIVKQNKVWANLKTLIDEENAAKLHAKEMKNPSANSNELNGPATWFASDTFKEHSDKFNNSWEKAMKAESEDPKEIIAEKDFVSMGLFARFNTMLSDKNRNNSFEFSNLEFICGQKLWYPENYSFEDDNLPRGWDIHKPLERPHDQLQIKISGKKGGAKMGSVLTIGGTTLDLCSKYRDVKGLIFPQGEPNEQTFFVNFKKEALAPLTNTRGSLLDVYSSVIGVEHATVNSIRRSLEGFIRNNPDKIDRKRIRTVQSHSEEVGLAYYDRGAGDYRSGVVHKMSKLEGSHSILAPVPEDVAAKRAKRDEEDKKIREEAAVGTSQKVNISKTAKVLPNDRTFMQKLLSSEKYNDLHSIEAESQFPGRYCIYILKCTLPICSSCR